MADTTSYKIVVNHEEQYSILPADQKLSGTWREAGKRGIQKQRLQYIEEVWTDITPVDYKNLMSQLCIQR